MKPILFNTEMVKAILKGRKTVTRRKIDIDIINHCDIDTDGTLLDYQNSYGDFINPVDLCRYKAGDILYVRETWWKGVLLDANENIIESGITLYRADEPNIPSWGTEEYSEYKWRPSIHMPKEAARIFLKVKDVRVERLQDMCVADCVREGVDTGVAWTVEARPNFIKLWDSTIKKSDLERYGWEANPWVWVIDFERIGKDEALSN